MTFFDRALKVGAASVAILAAAPALAFVTAESRLTEVSIRVIDLDLNDGVAAAITFGHDTTDGTFATASIFAGPDYALDNMAAGPGGPAYALVGTPYALASAYLNPGDLFSLRSAPSADALVTVSGEHASASAYAKVLSAYFELTQNTRLVVSAFGEVSTLSTQYGEWADASALLSISGFNGERDAFDALYSSVAGDGTSGSASSQRLRASFSSGATSTRGLVNVIGSASVLDATPAVPEPATNALIVAGLGLVWAARRRSAAAPRAPQAPEATST